jgi:hypothetical protein
MRQPTGIERKETAFEAALGRAKEGIIEAAGVRLSEEHLRRLLEAAERDGEARLSTASFVDATFTGNACFHGANFTGRADFLDAIFALESLRVEVGMRARICSRDSTMWRSSDLSTDRAS